MTHDPPARGGGLLRSLQPKQGGCVMFTDKTKSRIVRIGNLGKYSNLIIDIVHVEGLKHN